MSSTVTIIKKDDPTHQAVAVLQLSDELIIQGALSNVVEFELKSNYRIQVLASHKLLDDLGIPTADGIDCKDAGCNSGLEHRLRTLISLYTDLKNNLEVAKRVAEGEAIGLVKSRLMAVLNNAGRTH